MRCLLTSRKFGKQASIALLATSSLSRLCILHMQRTIFGHSGLIYSVSFPSDSKAVASGSDNNTINLLFRATHSPLTRVGTPALCNVTSRGSGGNSAPAKVLIYRSLVRGKSNAAGAKLRLYKELRFPHSAFEQEVSLPHLYILYC